MVLGALLENGALERAHNTSLVPTPKSSGLFAATYLGGAAQLRKLENIT